MEQLIRYRVSIQKNGTRTFVWHVKCVVMASSMAAISSLRLITHDAYLRSVASYIAWWSSFKIRTALRAAAEPSWKFTLTCVCRTARKAACGWGRRPQRLACTIGVASLAVALLTLRAMSKQRQPDPETPPPRGEEDRSNPSEMELAQPSPHVAEQIFELDTVQPAGNTQRERPVNLSN